MKEEIKFTIAIPSYKPNYLEQAIESIINQTYKNWELILLDDCSPYKIKDICFKFLEDTRIKYFKNDKNIGSIDLVDNWNKCLELSEGSFLICMGDDDMLDPNCLQVCASYIEKYNNYDLFHIGTEIIDENSNFYRYQESRPLTESVFSMAWHRISRKRDQFIGDFLFRVKALKKEGGFYKLPLAWASDDISAYKCAKDRGVVNIPNYLFKYRVNRFTITSNGGLNLKLLAISEEKKWYIDNLLIPEADNLIDRRFQSMISQIIDKSISNKRISTIAHTKKKQYLPTLIDLLLNRKRYDIKLLDICKGMFLRVFVDS